MVTSDDEGRSIPRDSDPHAGEWSVPEDPDMDDLLDKLEALQDSVDEGHERTNVRQTISLVEKLPGSRSFTRRVKYYTTKDVAEGFVGAIIFALPLLVEDGVFAIADWFVSVRLGPVPVVLLVNGLFVLLMVTGMLYYTDFRDVQIHRPIFGLVPRRLIGVLVISFVVAAGMMLMWGRLHLEEPSLLERLSRIAVIWTAAAFGATLGDILPGESSGEDLSELFADIRRDD